MRVSEQTITFTYKNHEGNVSKRTVTPVGPPMFWGTDAPWYLDPCWLVRGFCHDRQELRTFALSKMQNIKS